MFRPDKMCEIDIIMTKEKLDTTTNLLHELNLIEFFEIHEKDFSKYEHSDLNELSKKLLKTRSAITILKEFLDNNTEESSIENPADKTLELKNKLDELEKEELHLADDINRTNILKGLRITPTELKNSKDYIIGFVPTTKSRTLKNITCKTYKTQKRIYFITRNQKLKFKYKDFYLPKSKSENTPEKLEKTKNSILKIKSDLKKLAKGNLDNLRKKEHKLAKEIEILEAKPKFSKTQNFTIISGYVPKKQTKILQKKLEEKLENNFEITIKDATGDNIPVKLSNPSSVKKFEALLQMYSLPKHGEFDPTFVMFLIFPLFFGFILGDFVYGLISLLFFTILRFKMPQVKDFLGLLQFSAIISMIFGIIYGEFMGYELHGSFYGLFERSHNPEMLLIIAVIFGLIHINLGLIIGFINLLPKWKKAVYDKLSYIILQLGALFLYLGITSNSQSSITTGTLLLIFSLILIYMGHGFIGIMEVPSFFTNILSYARLMAVGLSSIAIAVLVNDFTGVFFSKGILGIIGGILLFSIGHIFNIALGCFEGFLHTLRLHYVEFFTKFYSGGGREFKPFGTKIHQEE